MNQKLIVAFSVAECEKYQRYAVFGSRPNPFENMKSADPDAVRIQKTEAVQTQSNIPKKPVWKTVAFESANPRVSTPQSIGSSLGKIAGTVLILGSAWGLTEGINSKR